MMKKLLLFVVGLCSFLGSYAQYTSTVINPGGSQTALAKDASGNVYAVRAVSGAYTVVRYLGGEGTPQVLNPALTLSTAGVEMPWGLAVNSRGDVYISNPNPSNDWEIIKLTAPGYMASTIQSGRYFSTLTVDHNDNIIAAEFLDPSPGTLGDGDEQYRIVKYAAANELGPGTVLGSIPFPHPDNEDISYPVAMVVDAEDNIYITDFLTNDPAPGTANDGGRLIKLATPGYSTQVISTGKSISALAVDATGNLYSVEVTSATAAQVVRYNFPVESNATGTTLYAGLVSSSENYFFPWGMVVTSGGRIYVNDAQDDAGTPEPADGRYLRLAPPNQVPTDIALSNATVNQSDGINAAVGTLSTTDADADNTFIYTLATGTGDTDNASFNISGSSLRVNDAAGLAAGSYAVRIQTDDQNGGTFQKPFTITVVDDIVPSGYSVSIDQAEITLANHAALSFTFTGAEAGASFNYTITSSGGGTPVTGSGPIAATGEQITGIDVSGLSNGTLTLSVTLTDASDNAGAPVTDNVTKSVNYLPEITTTGGITTFTEPVSGSPTPVSIDGGLTVNDADNVTLAWATVAITGNFQAVEDVLGFTNDGVNMGNITGSYNLATGTLTLTSAGATATLAEWEAALRAVTYSNTSGNPDVATRTVSFVIGDGTDDSAPATKSVAVVAVNSAPVITAPALITVTEDVARAITSISFSDADAGAAPTTATFSVTTGSLSATSGSGVTVGGTASALTLIGTIADINAFIASSGITYTPPPNATGDVTLNVTINDNGNTGTGGVQQDFGTVTLQITGVNDAPVVTVPATIAVDEDVPAPLTGISFSDVDAGSSPVAATFSVANGTLTAVTAGGVTVAGSGTSGLVLTGSLADINTFVAIGSVTYITALDATSNVVLTVNINDNGNTGTGGAQQDTQTITLVVTAINDAPVNTVPGAQSVDQDGILVFSEGNGNAISVADVDAGGGTIRVTLTATNGLLTLSTTTGLSFSVGSGTASGTMTFEGSIADINLALAGLSFAPTSGYNGTANLQIITDDLGLTGSGGAQTDTDVIGITVNPINPVVTAVGSATPDGLYKIGDVISLTVTFDQAVTVDESGGMPTLLLETGSVDREAAYISGSGSNALLFHYTVQAGDVSADLAYTSTGALALNSATIRNSAGVDAALTLPMVGGAGSIAGQHDLVIDGVAPAVISVAVPTDGYHVEGDPLDFTVRVSENVTVDVSGGTPYLDVTIGTVTVPASYVSGSGSNALVFRYMVQTGDTDLDGIAVGGSIIRNGATIRDAAGNDATLELNNPEPTGGVLIYAVYPSAALSTTAVPLVNGAFTVTATFSEAVTGFTVGDFSVTNAGLSDLQTSDNITYTVLVTPVADGGVSLLVPTEVVENIAGNGNTASNALNLTYDGTAPVVTSVDVPTDGAYRSGNVLNFRVHYNEDIPTISGRLTLPVIIGSTTVQAHLIDTTRNTLTFSYAVQDGELDTNGIEIGPEILLDGGVLRDDAGNDATLTLAGVGSTDNVWVDAVPPVITSVDVPADGYHVEGDPLDFTVHFSEDVTVDASAGTPYFEVTIGTATVQAAYVSGSGTGALAFRYVVRAGEADLDGIALGGDMILNGGTLRDHAGNGASLTLHNAAPTDQVFVYSVRPTVTLSTESASPVNGPFTVTAAFSEAVTGFTVDDITVSNGTPGDLQTSDNISYTFLVTPAVRGGVQLSVAADVAVNIADNGNDASNTLVVQFDEIITGITLEEGSFVYDGTAKSLAITGTLPAGTSVSYGNNSRTEVGSQEVTATISGDNYEDLVLTAELTITPASITGVTLEEGSFVYDGTAKSLAITGTLPAGTSVSYGNNSRTDVGSHEVTATISGSNYRTLVLAAELTVAPLPVTVTAADRTKVFGTDDPGLTYGVIPALVAGDAFTGELAREEGEAVGRYVITQGTLSLSGNYAITFVGAELTITPASITGVTLEDGSFVYDGTAKSLAITGTLPEGTSVSYGNNSRTDVGSQEVTATISGSNYETLILKAGLKITPAERSIDFPRLPEKTFGDEAFDAGATASSGEVVSYTSSDPGVAEVNPSGRITINGTGTTTITATVPANGNYRNRPEVNRTLVVDKSSQTIEFAEVGEVHRDAGTVQLDVSASSDLPVSLSVDDPEVATVDGTSLHIHRLGTVRITATQGGDDNHKAAGPVTITVRVVDPAAELPMRVSKVVSPNGDGINEHLIIEGIKDYPDNKVMVFNRNGTVLYEAKGYNNGSIAFRGVSTGQQRLPAGTYFYVAEIRINGQWKYEKGWFVLRY
ncbi:Ig-like domain-containing protein [Parapedobacter sp. GCM10030251]|uniref:Ig-like domain-containing protein n=1 Tax=Parapedobacter sp. GCM10030251 TaxID=3273419 RepID=UPI00361CCEE7